MKEVIFVTGNANKARYFSRATGLVVKGYKLDIPEIQSLDLSQIITHKVHSAYDQFKKPVIVEDTSLIILSFGKLPGPFVKWFIEELGLEKICRLADVSEDRRAIARTIYAYYDGQRLEQFDGSLNGRIAEQPKGKGGYGWNPIFIPDSYNKTLGEMSEAEFTEVYRSYKPVVKVAGFLKTLTKDKL